jgi:hypothetical protein
MTSKTHTLAAQVAALPLTEAARREALYYVAAGESLAQLFVSISDWLDASPSLKPSYYQA